MRGPLLRSIVVSAISTSWLATLTEACAHYQTATIGWLRFNYGGQWAIKGIRSNGWDRAPDGRLTHLLDVEGTLPGEELTFSWTFSTRLHQHQSIQRLADRFIRSLRDTVAHCMEPGVGGYTPSDFPLAALSQVQLDRLLRPEEGVEDIYALSPVQRGVLFHCLLSPEVGLYFVQTIIQLHGDLDPARLERAWRRVLERHSALRTVFSWEALSEPIQVVHHSVPAEWQELDWGDLPLADQRRALEELLVERGTRHAHLTERALVGCTIIRLGEAEHCFILHCHHILLDGWSTSIVIDELSALYDDPAIELLPPRPFRDFITWCSSQDLNRARRFWAERLEGFTTATRFGQTVSPVRTLGRHETYRRTLSESLSSRLLDFAQRHQLTLNTLLQGAYALTLSWHSGGDDVLFGVTYSGRTSDLVAAEDTVGLLINTLPFRVKLPLRGVVVSWLRRLQVESAQVSEFAGIPLVDIQDVSELPSGAQLFDSVFVFENYPVKTRRGGDGALSMGEIVADERTHYSLTVVVEPGAPIGITMSYWVEHIDGAQVARLASTLETILEELLDHPEQSVGDVSPLTASERHMLLNERRPPRAELPARTLHEGFERQAARDPLRTAIVFGEVTCTYGEVNRRANQLAAVLRSLGAQPGGLVGILVQRSPELVIGILAILKSGAAYVPLEPDYPEARLSFVLEDAGIETLVSHSALRSRVPPTRARLVWMDELPPESCHIGDDLSPLAAPGDLAYVIYTSGSTGLPKGVEVSHLNVLRLFAVTAQVFSFDASDTWTLFHSASFDFSVWEILGALLHGGRLVVVDRATVRSPDEFFALLVRERVSVLNQTPSAFLQLMSVEARMSNPDTLSLRVVIFGGESLVATRLRQWFERDRARPPRLVNMYGITETTIHVTVREVTREDALGPPRSLIGRPVSDLRVFLLDPLFRLVPAGMPGEMYVAGPGVARGYLNRPELTRSRFIERDVVAALAGIPNLTRLYRTGDMARHLPNGELEFLGRLDNQIKVRGFRIEPGEIEAVLGAHPLVREVVVAAIPDDSLQSGLAAYVVCRPHDTQLGTFVAELREIAQQSLPEHMVPGVFRMLDALPLTANGKIDRSALPDVLEDAAARGGEGARPQSPTEETLSEVWRDVLKIRDLRRADNFFEIGGHSLAATRVILRLQAIFDVALRIRLLFEHPTIASLGAEIDAMIRARSGSPPPPPISVTDRGETLPLSFSQQRLWFIDRLEGANSAYNVSLAVRLGGALDARALQAALERLVGRHEVLRMTFEDRDGVARQRIAPSGPFALATIDLTTEPAPEDELRRRLREDCGRAFDLRAGPLFRASLYRMGAEGHVLLLCMHHIVSDGWSLDVLWRDLVALYPACLRGEPSPLPALRYQYADFAAWQRAWLQGDVLASQLDYWTTNLTGVPALLNLPTDRPRPTVQGARGAVVSRTIAAPLTAELRRLGQDHGASLFMVCHAAFAVLLHRYTGQEDIVVGVPVAGRTSCGTESLVGLFVNALPLRLSLATGQGFDEVLRRARQVALDAFAHADVPFELLVSSLNVERSTSHTPLFQVMLSLDAEDAGVQPLGSLSAAPLDLWPDAVQYDLTLNLAVVDNTIRAGFEYSTDLFDAVTVERMTGHFLLLLEAAVQTPTCEITQLRMLTEPERAQLLSGWTSAESRYQPRHCVHELFEAQVRRTPFESAVTSEGESLTYEELSLRSDRLASALFRAGLPPRSPVAILLGDGPDQVVALLATLKAGGVIVGLPTETPGERLAQILGDVSPGCILTDSAHRARLPEATVVVQMVDGLDGQEPFERIATSTTPDAAAYIVYTSGSTGLPKGIIQPHSSFAQFIDWFASRYELSPGKRVAQWASMGYDGCYLEIFGSLCSGATVCMLPGMTRMDPEAVLAWTKRERITLLNVVPSFFRPMMASLEGEIASGVSSPLPDLQFLLLDGEVLSIDLARRWLAAFPDAPRLVNQYGPSECILATFHPVDGASTTRPSIPVGRPIDGRQILVLDRHGKLVPIGLPGEIWIRSRFLTDGYLNRPELTAAAFVANPLSSDPDDRAYRTGDSGRWLPDGNLEFLGRMDRQVKIRGVRLELTEIEEVIASHPAVRACAALQRAVGEDVRLVAYVVLRGALTLPKLRAFARERLPSAGVPVEFLEVASLPRTVSGKVDSVALLSTEGVSLPGAEAAVDPRTPTELAVAEVWDVVLGTNGRGIHENFFDRGGHSLVATRVISRLRTRFGVDLPVRAIFENPTIAALAKELDVRLTSQSDGAAPPPIVSVDRGDPLPLSFSQQRLWFIDQFEGANPAYNVSLAVRLHGALDARALEGALEQLVARHEVLRTTFEESDGVARQRVEASAPVVLALADLAETPGPEDELERRLREDGCRIFDLRTGPLFRASLYRMSAEDHALLLCMHHIVSDGWSLGVLWRDLEALYRACLEGKPSRLPPLRHQYADFAVWQRTWLRGEALAAHLRYWMSHLTGAPPLLRLPIDRPRPRVLGSHGEIQFFEVDASVAAKLTELSRQQGLTLFITCYAGLVALLARYSGDDDMVIGTPVANRYHDATEDLIGFFVNTVPLRIRVDGDPTFLDLLGRARRVVLDAFAHQDVPFEQLIAELKPVRSLAHAPLFQVMLAFDNNNASFASLADLQGTVIEVRDSAVQYDLTLSVSESDDRLLMGFEYNSELFSPSTIRRMCGHFKELLAFVTRFPATRLSTIRILSDDEREELLCSWSNAGTTAPVVPGVIQLFEEQVGRVPDAVAVVCDDERLSYRELGERVAEVAEMLRGHGVGTGVHVGVCLPRGVDAIILLLATMKAGGVYVPLDAGNPAQRMHRLLIEAEIGVLITAPALSDRVAGAPVKTLLWRLGSLGVVVPRPVRAASSHSAGYILHTSGSTGQPKGVIVAGDSLATHVATAVEAFGITDADSVLQFASMSVDVSLEQVFCALTVGAALVVRGESVWSIEEFTRKVATCRLTVTDLSPGYLDEVVREWLERRITPSDLGLRLMIVGGEQLGMGTLKRWYQLPPHRTRLINAYGPTETTIGSTLFELTDVSPQCYPGTVPIGRPLRGRTAYILDATREPVPIGLVGELYLGGAGLAEGYWNRADLTDERFIDNPFGGGRLYKTGDLARWLPDGNIALSGRGDEQVKVRGHRVELEEVEAAVRQHPSVKDAVVLLQGVEPSVDDLLELMAPFPDEDASAMVELARRDAATPRSQVTRDAPEVSVTITAAEGFIRPPTPSQRNWLLRRSLDEFVDDLVNLDRISRRFVPGSERAPMSGDWSQSPAHHDRLELIVQGQQVMQEWERPLMREMAGLVAGTHGDVLEIGFGMGISATYIQEHGVSSHTIVECNDDVARALDAWRKRYPSRDIRVVRGRWQEVVPDIGPFDAVLFDAYPTSEVEFAEEVIDRVTFAESFFPVACACLRPGGVFTYYSNEIDSFSRRHQRAILAHFESISLKVVRPLQPPPNSHYWWADSMVAVCATKRGREGS